MADDITPPAPGEPITADFLRALADAASAAHTEFGPGFIVSTNSDGSRYVALRGDILAAASANNGGSNQ